MQWFIAHAKNTVHIAACLREPLARKEFEAIVEHIVAGAPHLMWTENLEDDGFEKGHDWSRDRYMEFHEHETLPEAIEMQRERCFSAVSGPAFAAVCHTARKANAQGFHSLVVLTSRHALTEGVDLVQVMRGKRVDHTKSKPNDKPAGILKQAAALLIAPVIALQHLVGAHFHKPVNEDFCFRSIAVDSGDLRIAARQLKITQRALVFALVLYCFSRPNLKNGKTQMMIYTTLADFGISNERDDYLNFKIRLLFQRDKDSFAEYAVSLDRALAKQAEKGNFNQHYYNRSLGFLRKLLSWFPRLSSQSVYGYSPHDMMLSMVPPVRPTGIMSRLRNGILFGGTVTGKGRNCVFIPGIDTLTFNFWAEESYYQSLPGLLKKLDELGIACSTPEGW